MTQSLSSSPSLQFASGERSQDPVARLIAFYLPQFHPIPENDDWWGKGFTEWTNVARARPRYRGHQQPVLPGDLGFYDLRVPEVREKQAEMARSAGVEGFCYWHYWFGNGRRILERPFNEVLNSGSPNFPFCLAWANQSWTGIWYGEPKRVLVEQAYPGVEDEKRHFEEILPAFRDDRYMKVDGKPIFVVFAPHDMPDPKTFIEHWRRLASESGLPGLYFVAMSNDFLKSSYSAFDAITPQPPADYLCSNQPKSIPGKIIRKIKNRLFRLDFVKSLTERYRGPARHAYEDVVRNALLGLPEGPRFHPCVLPNWDNTPRSGDRGVVFEHSTPLLFRQYLAKAINHVEKRRMEERIIFLKAWNEWAEGNFVEPDSRFGHGYLDVMSEKMLGGSSARGPRAHPDREPPQTTRASC